MRLRSEMGGEMLCNRAPDGASYGNGHGIPDLSGD
jgi:hypothetical protein